MVSREIFKKQRSLKDTIRFFNCALLVIWESYICAKPANVAE